MAGNSFTAEVPTVAPLHFEVSSEMVQEVWDTFVKPGQDKHEPQSGEMRVLMGILRSVHKGLKDYEDATG